MPRSSDIAPRASAAGSGGQPLVDDDLTAQLHWPPDPLDGRVTHPTPKPPASTTAARPDVPARRGTGAAAAPAGSDLDALRTEIAALRLALEELSDRVDQGPLQQAVSELGEELIALRRRITLRANTDLPAVDDDQLERIVERVLERAAGPARPAAPRRRR